jgi:hypothetical protein
MVAINEGGRNGETRRYAGIPIPATIRKFVRNSFRGNDASIQVSANASPVTPNTLAYAAAATASTAAA